MTAVISIENLSKSYRLGQIGTGTFAHDLNVWWARLRGRPNPQLRVGEADHGNRDGEEIWALRDVSFEVDRGEVLGIIGRNGAGKSTLLKILSRVTAPTSGRVRVKGRVASLLEVGTGFHPELTGRENVFLNGAILGMSRHEIARKFDEIVSFAEVEKFIDTPVKRYSSGMYVRLAFAVAAHLEPEILVVDEVLAVGDAEFQKKCLGKMGAVAQEGRTVLFVSHNMGAITRITRECLWLDKGRLMEISESGSLVNKYIQASALATKIEDAEANARKVQLIACGIETPDGNMGDGGVPFGVPFKLSTQWKTRDDLINVSFFVRVEAADGAILGTLNSRDFGGLNAMKAGRETLVEWIARHNPLLPGSYFLTLAVQDMQGTPIEIYWHALELKISDVNAPQRFFKRSSAAGYVHLAGEWRIDSV